MIGNGTAIFSQSAGKFSLGNTELTDEGTIRHRTIQRIQVLPLDIFDQCHLRLGIRVHLADNNGDGFQAGKFGRAPAAFAGYQFVALL